MPADNPADRSVVLVAREASVVDAVTAVAGQMHSPVTHFESVSDWIAQSAPSSRGVPGGGVPGTWKGCLVLGVVLDSSEGLTAIRQAVGPRAGLPIIAVSPQPSVDAAVAAMRAGVMNVLTWPTSDEKLKEAFREALHQADAIRPARERQVEVARRLATLTESERAVLDSLLGGKANKEIAAELEIGLRTVELRRNRIMSKMAAKNIVDLIRMVCEARARSVVDPNHQ